jgi:CelD/BcsL family acetyltransferase involved in cellulose biosynthesis
MNVTVVRNFHEFQSLENAWDALVDSLEHPSPYLTHAWFRVWWTNFQNDDSLHILLVREGNNLVGILPLRRTLYRRLKIFHLPGYFFLTNSNSPTSNIICTLEKLPVVVKAIRTFLENSAESWGKIVLGNVPTEYGTVAALSEGLSGPKTVTIISPWRERNGAYYIDITGSFAEYYSGLGAAFRKNRNYIHNVMARKGSVEFTVEKFYNPESLKLFYDIEDTGWKHATGKPLKRSKLIGKHFADMAETFAKLGWFRLCALRYAGIIIAMVYGLEFKGTFYFLKVAVDYNHPETRRLGPGQVIQYHLLRYCFDNGLKKSDFYGGCDPYEAHWTKKINQNVQINIFYRRSIASKLWFYFWESCFYSWKKGTGQSGPDF